MLTQSLFKLEHYTRQTECMIKKHMPEFEEAYEEFANEDITDLVKGTEFAIKDVEDSDDSDDDICIVNEQESDDIDVELPAISLTDRVMNDWTRRRDKFSHDYARVGRLLCPNPTIQQAVLTTTTLEDTEAVERLIFKLLIPPHVVGTSRTELKAQLMKDWHRELKLFQNYQGVFAKDWIWELAKVRKCVVIEI